MFGGWDIKRILSSDFFDFTSLFISLCRTKNVIMAKKEEYKIKNQEFLKEISVEEGVVTHPSGILYKVINSGDGKVSPVDRSIVTVHYRGALINGREFDNSWKRSCPEALRLTDVIDGWRIALKLMHVGDRWMVYIPYELGYGTRTSGPIPGFSTLIFEIELLGIA